MRNCTKLAVACVLTVFVAACGDDGDELNNGPGISNANPGGDADVSTDAGTDVGSDTDPDGGDTDDPDPDGGTEVEGNNCASPTDLGSLAAGEEHVFDSTLLEPAANLDTTCELDSTGSGVRVFSLEVDVTSQVEFWTDLTTSRLDLRDGSCASPDEVLTCTDGGTYTANLEAGQTYHLVVWGDFSVGDFQMRADVTEAVCSVNEPNWCDSGQINECDRGTSIDTYACAEDCADQSSCQADACSSAIQVDLSSGGPVTVSGNTGAYSGTWSADQMSGCGFTDGTTGSDTPSQEVFVEVAGLTASDQLSVESTEPGDYAFFVLDGCSATECLAAVDDDHTGAQKLTWQATEDGSYIVVIETFSSSSRPFNFVFSTQ